jgi:hypothetical protein
MVDGSDRGLNAKAVHRLIRTVDLVSLPACAPLSIFALFLGIALIGAGWWTSLPALLPGDEAFNLERVAGLTVHTFFPWSRAPDTPAMRPLTEGGVAAFIAGVIILACGTIVKALRRLIDEALMRAARALRLVVVDDPAAATIANESTACTTVLLGDRSYIGPGLPLLNVPLDGRFLETTLPRCASGTRELLALGVDAGANINLARRLVALRRLKHPSRPLDRLSIRIDPRELRTAFGRDNFGEFLETSLDARLVSLPDSRWRCLLRDQPPNKVRLIDPARRPSIVVIGLGETGLELLARLCAQAQSPAHDPLLIALVDAEALMVARELTDLWPGLTLVAEFVPIALEPRLPQSAMALVQHLHKRNLAPTCIYLALEDAALAGAWEHEISLTVRTLGQDSPLVLSIEQTSRSDRSLLAGEEVIDQLEENLHIDYLLHCGGNPSPAAVQWARLPFDYQEENRSIADHVWTKVRDLDLVLTSDPREGDVQIPDAGIELAAAAEHRRWVASRAVAGWRFGVTRCDSKRVHPSLVAWGELAEVERCKTKDAIRHLPGVLRGTRLGLRPLFGLAVPRSGATGAGADDLIDEARRRATENAGAMPNLVVAVEDARSFRLAQRLATAADITVSLVVAQPLDGLAVAAGLPVQAASDLAKAARTVWIGRPETLDEHLARWPAMSCTTA